jgi:hypothetical protein
MLLRRTRDTAPIESRERSCRARDFIDPGSRSAAANLGPNEPARVLMTERRMLRKVLHNARKRKMLFDVPTSHFREATLRNEFTT